MTIQVSSRQGRTIAADEALRAGVAVMACGVLIVSLGLLAVSWVLLRLPISVS